MQLLVVTLISFRGLELKNVWFWGGRIKHILEILLNVIDIQRDQQSCVPHSKECRIKQEEMGREAAGQGLKFKYRLAFLCRTTTRDKQFSVPLTLSNEWQGPTALAV